MAIHYTEVDTDNTYICGDCETALLGKELFIPLLDLARYSVDTTTCCLRCKDTFFFTGCPHCGNTFLNRDILRQTA